MARDDRIELTRWEPLSVAQTVELMTGLDCAWWIAGGWAIDLFLNRSTREHADTDVLVLRADQVLVCRHFSKLGWELSQVDRPGHLRPLKPDEIVRSSIHDLWCRPDRRSAWALQLMLAESDGDRWIYRRDSEVTLPLSEVGLHTADGVPYLAPQVELLFKSKSPRPQDEADFTLTAPQLPPAARRWLASAIGRTDPSHPWLPRLR
jgi:Aminoglycoside-2''-adenylyltransferase